MEKKSLVSTTSLDIEVLKMIMRLKDPRHIEVTVPQLEILIRYLDPNFNGLVQKAEMTSMITKVCEFCRLSNRELSEFSYASTSVSEELIVQRWLRLCNTPEQLLDGYHSVPAGVKLWFLQKLYDVLFHQQRSKK